jgi:hypothetical protein
VEVGWGVSLSASASYLSSYRLIVVECGVDVGFPILLQNVEDARAVVPSSSSGGRLAEG